MLHWKPQGDYFVGDCMPFWHDGVFHLFYLIDEGHHQGLGGMGGHQWAHVSTRDLRHWQHHPLALPVDRAEERSICTGSVFHHGGRYHAFYATRLPDWRQVLSRAVSDDGVQFAKCEPNPFFTPPAGYDPLHFRDPFVWEDGGEFHMLVTASRTDGPLPRYGGCLAHLVSSDLEQWRLDEPLLLPGYDDAPECSDLFEWNGWWYLLFSNHLVTRYRMARAPLGPWRRPPGTDVLDSPLSRVLKTAAFAPDAPGGGRRIGAAWLGTRAGDRDDGKPQWGGSLLLRELVQHPDGTLGTKFAPETLPPAGDPLPVTPAAVTPGVTLQDGALCLSAPEGLAVAVIEHLPHDFCVEVEVTPGPGAATFGLRLRAADFAGGYDLALHAPERTVRLNGETIDAVEGLQRPYQLQVLAHGSILDACIDGRRCIVDRCPAQAGDKLYLYAHNAGIALRRLSVRPL